MPLLAGRERRQYLHKASQSPYSVNMLRQSAWPPKPAVKDTEYIANYVAEALAARELLRAGLEKLGIAYARSSANFILGYFGARAIEIRGALRAKSILVRRSRKVTEIPGGDADHRQGHAIRALARSIDELERIW